MIAKSYHGNNKDIERLAEAFATAVRARLGDNNLRGRRLVEEAVRLTGGLIRTIDDPSAQEVEGGSLVIRGEHDYTISLSPYTTPLRDNFTIAHELGHYVLHFALQSPQPAVPIGFTRYGTGPIEWQANRFAAAILMPENDFKDAFRRYSQDVYLVSGHFEVSGPAVKVRGQSLGLNFE